MTGPLSVAVSVVIHDGSVVMINRSTGAYVGRWGLPGGKIEPAEHPGETAVREIREEAGLSAEFDDYLGVVSSTLEKADTTDHFLLHVCSLSTTGGRLRSTDEGETAWIALTELDELSSVVPSDQLILDELVRSDGGGYYRCAVEPTDDGYRLASLDSRAEW